MNMDIQIPLTDITYEDKIRHARNEYLEKLFPNRLFKIDRRICDNNVYFDDIFHILSERMNDIPLEYKDIEILFSVGNGAEEYDPDYKNNKLKIRRFGNYIPSLEYVDKEEFDKHIRFGKYLNKPLKFISLPAHLVDGVYNWKKHRRDEYDACKINGVASFKHCCPHFINRFFHKGKIDPFLGSSCDYYCKRVDYVKAKTLDEETNTYIDEYALRCKLNRYEMIKFGENGINELCVYAATRPLKVPNDEKEYHTDLKDAKDPLEAVSIANRLYCNSHHIIPLFSISFDDVKLRPELEAGFEFKFSLY